MPVVLACAVMTAHAEPPVALDPVEQQIVAAVDRENDAAIALLEAVVNINSGTAISPACAPSATGSARSSTRSGSARAGWTARRSTGRGTWWRNTPGRGPHVLLIGHLDTVFDPDHPFQRFERLSPTEARGPGIIDMKGGDVIIVHALKALHGGGRTAGRAHQRDHDGRRGGRGPAARPRAAGAA